MKRTAADVVLILDVTGSMINPPYIQVSGPDGSPTSSSISAGEAMVRAANQAIKTMMTANPENRISIFAFSAPSNVGHQTKLMPLDSYTTPAGGDYLTYSVNSGGTYLGVAPGVKTSQETTYTHAPVRFSGNTNTQQGLVAGVKDLISEINNTEFTGERIPYVLLLTDGEANLGYTNWSNPSMDAFNLNATTTSSRVPGVTALTMLSAAYYKESLTAAYQNFNSNPEIKANWFNIGLKVSGNTDNAARALLDPEYTNNGTDSTPIAKNVKDRIATYTSASYANTPELRSFGVYERTSQQRLVPRQALLYLQQSRSRLMASRLTQVHTAMTQQRVLFQFRALT